ncbi:MAG: hypothetical protein WAU11_00680 [Ignavibacteriaceae bacterium]
MILLLQVIPNQQSEFQSNQKLPEVSFSSNLFVLNVINGQQQNQLVRQNPDLNYSAVNNIYDKHDTSFLTDQTDAKKIYNGGFSKKLRVSTFLTVMFATGT